MANYLGETRVDVATHPTYARYTEKDWALLYIQLYGGIDGEHHKNWVLDQVSRILHGCEVLVKQARWDDGTVEDRYLLGAPTPSYLTWVQEMSEEYGYDVGTPP